MIDCISLSCPTCGAKLDVGQDDERLACAHCGTESVVRRRGAAVSLRPVVEAITRVQAGTDRTAAELAIVRLKQDRDRVSAEYAEVRKGLWTQLAMGFFGFPMALNVVAAFFDDGLAGMHLVLGGIGIALVLACRSGWRKRKSREKALEIESGYLERRIRENTRIANGGSSGPD